VQRGDLEWTADGGIVRASTIFDKASENYLWQQSMQQKQARGAGVQASAKPVYGLSAAQSYAAQGMALLAAGKLGVTDLQGKDLAEQEIAGPNYAALLSGGMALTDMTEDYTEKSVDLNAELNKQTEIMLQMEKAYGSQNAKVMEQREKVSQLKEGVTELNASYSDAMNNMALKTLQAKDASEEQQLEFARASGMITQDAYEAQTGLNKITDAFKGGQISAKDYANAVQNVSNWAQGMSEQQFNVYIDIWIRTHGQTNISNAVKAGVDPGKIAQLTGGWTGGELASFGTGGKLGAQNGLVLVGDAPGGGFTPYTELIDLKAGRIYNAKETRVLRDMGMLDGARRAYFGLEDFVSSGTGATPASGLKIPKGSKLSSSAAKPSGGATSIGGISLLSESAAEAAAVAAQAGAVAGASNVQVAVMTAAITQQQSATTETNKLLKQLIAIQSGQARDIGRNVAEANVTYK
jgi:hypothetical protein